MGKEIFIGIILIIFIFGVIRFNYFDFSGSVLSQFADLKAGEKNIPVTLAGFIVENPDVNGSKSQLIFRAKELIVPGNKLAINELVLIYVNSFPEYKFGDELLVFGVLATPQNFLEDFDYVAYLKRRNLRTIMFYPKLEKEKYVGLGFFEKAKKDSYKKIFSLKDRFELAINKSISEPNASFLNGILLGSRQNISQEMTEAFSKTGTTHILAISGYNIMIISWAALAGLVWFFKRRMAFWISVFIIILFTVLTGASASVVRASIMGLLLLFANGYGRLYEPKNSIILAGFIMIFLNPFVLVFDIGFQLSFLAVIGLMYLYPYLDNKLKKVGKIGGLKEILLMTVSAQIVVAPLLIYYFKSFSLVSLPANVLILPFIPAAMFAGFISGLAGMIFLPLGQIIGWFAWSITTYQIEIVKFLSLV